MIFTTQIMAHNTVAVGTHEVVFKRPNTFTYKAGQYIQIKLTNLMYTDPRGATRLFSVVSSPYDMAQIKVVFRASDSGFKKTLMSLPVGAEVRIEQASGSFILPQQPANQHVFIAGGVGIAPFMSYLYQNIEQEWSQHMTLMYGNRSEENAAYIHTLRNMTQQQKMFSLREIYEKPDASLFAELVDEYEEAVWWVVGPPVMTATVLQGLHAGGVFVENIITESFEGY